MHFEFWHEELGILNFDIAKLFSGSFHGSGRIQMQWNFVRICWTFKFKVQTLFLWPFLLLFFLLLLKYQINLLLIFFFQNKFFLSEIGIRAEIISAPKEEHLWKFVLTFPVFFGKWNGRTEGIENKNAFECKRFSWLWRFFNKNKKKSLKLE